MAGSLPVLAVVASAAFVHPTQASATPTATPGAFVFPTSKLDAVACPALSSTCYAIADNAYHEGFGYVVAEPTGLNADVIVPITNGVAGAPVQIQPYPGIDLEGIACPNTSLCWAVGFAFTNSLWRYPVVIGVSVIAPGVVTVGTVQGVQPASQFPDPEFSSLLAIACPTASTCYAVGYDGSHGLVVPIKTVNGFSTLGPSQEASESVPLNGISCPPALSTCYAVGGADDDGPSANGEVVVPVSSTGPGASVTGLSNVDLQDLSCPSSTTCYAVGKQQQVVGNAYVRQGTVVPLSISSAGAISLGSPVTISSNSSLVGGDVSVLEGIACLDSFDCLAVGENSSGQSFDFGGSIVPIIGGTPGTPSAVPNSHVFDSVDCTGAGATPVCYAVGQSSGPNGYDGGIFSMISPTP